MQTGEKARRWLWLGGVSCTTVAWALLFYANYWNASVTAFGDITSHLADLKLVLWEYLAGGVALAGTWVTVLRRFFRQDSTQPIAERVRSHGN